MTASKGISYPACEHFGESLRGSKFGHRMTRAMYAYPNRSPKERPNRERLGEALWEGTAWVYRDEDHTRHSDAYLLVQRDRALVNFDLSMRYFESLDAEDFEAALEEVLAKGRTFKPVTSLSDWDDVTGAYVMVFDGYKQFYIGQSEDIRKRIRQHWMGRKPFDRVVFGTPYNSIFPVDELRALDTTRIYAARSRNPFAVEERAEKAADPRFCLNRMVGGAVTNLTLMITSMNPRSREHGIASPSLTFGEYEEARDSIMDTISRAETQWEGGLATALAAMDMTIYSVKSETGEPFIWSRRDAVGRAAARGELSVDDYAAFLEAMGETIVWPEN